LKKGFKKMSTIELRQIITEQISHIDDVSFLKAIKTIIESKVSEGTYKLSDYQKKRIDIARQQLKNGQTIAHEDLQKEIDQWLSSK
jgi:gas vesicle protein